MVFDLLVGCVVWLWFMDFLEFYYVVYYVEVGIVILVVSWFFGQFVVDFEFNYIELCVLWILIFLIVEDVDFYLGLWSDFCLFFCGVFFIFDDIVVIFF